MSVIKFNQNPGLNYSLALNKIEEQDYLFAIKLLKDAIKLDNNVKFYVELAELYYKLGQYDESTATYIELFSKICTMEIALAALHSHQASLGVDLNPDNLSVSSGCFFKMTRRRVENNHLDRILKEYHKISAKIDEPKLVNLKERAILRNLTEAKELALKGDYAKALTILDNIKDCAYENKVLELKTITFFGAGDYVKAIEYGCLYNELVKGNPIIARSVLYSMYVLGGNKHTPEFRNKFNDFEKDILVTGKPEDAIGLLELAEMVEYNAGANKLMKKMLQQYSFYLSINMVAISFYGARREYKEMKKILARSNTIFPNCPSISYFNCLLKERDKSDFSESAWYGLIDQSLASQYARVIVVNYLKEIVTNGCYYNPDIFKVAIAFYEKDKLKEFLTIKEIEDLDEYQEILIWGIENPYLGIENKVLLIELLISRYPNLDRIFSIPTELGISCLKLAGFKADVFDVTESSIYNAVYSNLIFTDQDFDKIKLLSVIKGTSFLFDDIEKNLLCAAIHFMYYEAKKYESQLELIADAYQVSVNDLKALLENIN